MPGLALPEEGASMYQEELKTFFRSKLCDDPVFDLVFLGVGSDGHTASLFPGQISTEAPGKWVAAVKGGNPNVYRLTLTYEVLNRARRVFFLVSGRGKAEIVASILEKGRTDLPARKVNPSEGALTWLLDQEAASLLKRSGRP
jgi:6-phosphogluconolactonase